MLTLWPVVYINYCQTCELYVVHPSTKSIEAVTFFVAYNEGSILISCTSLALGLIKPHVSLDHLPPGSSIISSSADQPINDKSQLTVHMPLENSKHPSSLQAQRRFLLCVQIKNNFLPLIQARNICMCVPRKNNHSPSEFTSEARKGTKSYAVSDQIN